MKKYNYFLRIINKAYIILIKIIIFIVIYLFISFRNNIFDRKYNKKDKPKISIFLPIYNKDNYLIKSIKSIQNQSLKNIEIIAINDYSTDKTLILLKKLSKEDPRIKIINNDRNHGLLYTRAMGILNSTGKYLMNLDPDDELKGKNSLEYLYKIARTTNVDFLCFAYNFKNNIVTKCSNYYKILKQPKLFSSLFNKNNKINDFLIWNKLIKRELLLKAYQVFKKTIYHDKWNYHEDNIWSLLIYKYAKSMICIKKVIYIYKSHEDSLMHKRIKNSIIETKNYIYKEKMIYKLLNKDLKINNYINKYYHSFLRINKKIQILKKNKKFKNKFFNTLNKCMKLKLCSYYLNSSINKLLTIK